MSHSIPYLHQNKESSAYPLNFSELCNDFLPSILFMYDVNTSRVNYTNSQVTKLLGYHQEMFYSSDNTLLDIVYKEDILVFSNEIEQMLRLEDTERHTFRIRFTHRDGSCRDFKVLGRVQTRNPFTKKPEAMLLMAEEITELVRKENDAQTKQQLFDETEKMLQLGTWSWMADTDDVEWTDGIYDILEYSREECPVITNDFYMDHILPEYVDNVRNVIYAAISENKGFALEYMVRTKHGREKYIFTKGKAVLDDKGRLKKILGITRDITAKINFEKTRERNIRELNRSNKELEEFAYVASHDLHEPLRKILTFSERVKTRYANALGDDGNIYLDRIRVSAVNMRALIDNLLEFSRISRGSRTFVESDLNVILKEVISDQELRIEESATTIIIKNLPTIEAVPAELRQLFNNLLGNALKFRRKDVKPNITITCKKLTSREKSEHLLPFDQCYFQINIQDNGIGFDTAYGERIFEIFQRLHGKAEYAGSGIGLAICKKIVDNHEGAIFATSEPGLGSTFSVILPEKQLR